MSKELTPNQMDYYQEVLFLSQNYILSCASAMREFTGAEFKEANELLLQVQKFTAKLVHYIIVSNLPNSHWIDKQTLPNELKRDLLALTLSFEVMNEPNPYTRMQ